jgi:tetratricopeptide (TPR) repeat protein
MNLMIGDRLSVLPDKIPQRLSQFIHRRSEGTPFVAEELLRAMLDQGMIEVWNDPETNQHRCRLRGEVAERTESLPGSVRGLILSRIDHMSADEQITLKVASILGRRFSFRALVELLSAAHQFKKADIQQYLDGFADMDLVSVEQSEPELIYRFSHQVTLEVAYDSLPFSQRRQLHETAARWFEANYLGDDFEMGDLASLGHEPSTMTPHLGDLAAHYRAADNKSKELIYDLLAGRRAALLYQNEEAERYLSRALELLPEDALLDRFTVLRDRELLYTLMSRREDRKADLQAMQLAARTQDSNHLKGEVAVLQAIYQCGYGRAKSAATLAQSALQLGQASGQADIEAKAHRWLGAALQMQGEHQQARVEMERGLELAETVGNNSLVADVATELARFAQKRGEFTACLEYCDKALALSREEGHLANEARILRRMASAHLGLGNLPQSSEFANEARNMQEQIGDRRQEAVTLDIQGRIALASGDYAEAKAYFERSLGVRHEIRDHAGQYRSLMLLGRACLLMGAFEKARLCYEQALEDAEEMELAYPRAEINARLVALEFSVGDNIKAKNHGLEAARRLSELNDPSLLATTLTSLGSALTELEEYDSAAAAFGNAVKIRKHLGQETRLMEAVSGSAYLDFKCNQPERAMEKVNEILDHFGDKRISGIEQPARIYLICYEILDQATDSRAPELLKRGYEQLQETANAISDPVLQESFMQCVAENRAVAYYYHQLNRDA